MAKVKLILTIALVTALLALSYGVPSTEGRELKARENLDVHWSLLADAGTYAFRPTSPGHSPGAGHPLDPTLGAATAYIENIKI